MRILARLLGRLVLALGWAAFVFLAVLFLAEKAEILTWLGRRWLVENAGIRASDLEIDHVSLGWWRSTVEIRGLRLGEAGEALLLEDASLCFGGFSAGLPRLQRVDVRGGHLRLSPGLFDRMAALAEKLPPRPPGARHTAEIPSITVRDLAVDLETRRFGRLPIGTVDVAVREVADGAPVLTGRLIPSLATAPGGAGEIILAGQESEPGTFDVSASAQGVPLSSDYLPEGTVLDALRPLEPHGTLALSAQGEISFDGHTAPRGAAKVSLTDGELLVGNRQPIRGLRVDLEAEYSPASVADLWNIASWVVTARADARWKDVSIASVARLGDAGDPSHRIAAELHVPSLQVSRELLELFGNRRQDEALWSALEPRGEADLWLGLTCSRDWNPGEAIGPKLSVACEVGMSGHAGITYHGFPSAASGRRDQGFPLPLEELRGSVLYGFDPGQHRAVKIGIADVDGTPPRGSLHGRGLVGSPAADAPRDAPGQGYMEVDLDIRAEHLPIDGSLRSALQGLAGPVPPADTWEPFAPSGGEITGAVRLVRSVDMRHAAARVALELEEVALAWKDLPVPVNKARGRLEFVSDGRSESGLGAVWQGIPRTASDLHLALRYQTDPSGSAPAGGKSRIDEIVLLAVGASHVSLTGDDKKILVTQFPAIGSAMDYASPRGFADVTYSQVRAGPGPQKTIAAEVVPREAELVPVDFKVPVAAVRGRVLVNAVEDRPEAAARTETTLAPLVGILGGDMQVAATARFPSGSIRLRAAGLDPSNPALLGAVGQAIRTPGEPGGPDLGALSVEGLMDAEGEIASGGEKSASLPLFRFFLRENSLSTTKSFRLDRLLGILELRGENVLHGHGIQASLAGTRLDLEELRFSQTREGFELTTNLRPVENLPLDRDHLRGFVDEQTLEALLGSLGWRGRIDLKSGRVRITGPRQGDTRLEFSGEVQPSEMQVQLGLPFSIQSAAARIDLIYEGGHVRAMCRIHDLYGRIADRKLDRADLLITYVEPRLSIESIQGELEGGAIRPLGEGAERGGTAFSIDLEEPFPFQLALDLRGVELSGLLRGIFATSFATHGRLNCQLRLTGDTRRVLGIQGSGSLQVFESRLWSVPVFRALFSQLGIDDKLVFDQMAANVRVKNGVISTDDISIHSPILILVGKGSIDFDGSLQEDLQVRYDLIDRLGPLTRILYAIQKQLLSVAIRGDLARPIVIFRYPWTRVSAQADRYRSIPLPPLAPMRPRF